MKDLDGKTTYEMALECALLAAKRVGVDFEALKRDAHSGVMDSASSYASHVTTPYKTAVLERIADAISKVSGS